MGLFGSSKKTYVSSVIYNMAGDTKSRPNYLKTTVVSSVLNGKSIADSINKAYLDGPGISMKRFSDWAKKSGFNDTIGLITSTISVGSSTVDEQVLIDSIEHEPTDVVTILTSSMGPADYSVWAEQWMLENHPELIDTEWDSDLVDGEVVIKFEDETTTTFIPENFYLDQRYLYFSYTIKVGETTSTPKVVIYRKGTGNAAFDTMLSQQSTSFGTFFPYLPIRMDNRFVSETYLPQVYKESKKGFKKAFGKDDFDKIIEQINDNPDIADIDYTYVIFGCSLNVLDKAALMYIFKFFEAVDTEVPYGSDAGQINIRNNDKFNITIYWDSIVQSNGTGKAKSDAKTNDLWWEKDPANNTVILNWQVSKSVWRKLTMRNLRHRNEIYNGKAVEISALEALDDTDESGFVVPLHDDVFASVPMVQRTQMATANTFLMFNCYQVVKKKWYQTGIFKVLLIVVIIVVSVYTGGAAASAGGILGSNVAVGTALGIAAGGIAAAIVGAIANAVAAMVLVAIIQRGAVALFGDKIGSIIGAIASVVALNVGTAYAATGSFQMAFTSLFSPSGLLMLTDAVGAGYQGYMQAELQKMTSDYNAQMEDYQSQMAKVNQAYTDNIGTSGVAIDPLAISGINQPSIFDREDMQTFLDRTLMMGSDLLEMSMSLVDRFVELNLELEVR